MKKQHILSICIAGALLTACGSGGSAGIKNNNTNITPPDNGSTNNNSSTDNGTNNNGSANNGSANNGSTTDNGTNNNTPNTNPTNGKLPYPHKVPAELQSAVKDALQLEVDWNPAPGDKHSFVMNGKTHNKGDKIDLTELDLGLTETSYSAGADKDYSDKGKMKVYRQNYSVIMAFLPTEGKLASNNSDTNEQRETISLSAPIGYLTKDLPTAGKATYKGKAFYQTETGNLNLAVNFGDKKVSGNISGLSVGKVKLHETDISMIEFEDVTTDEGGLTGAMGYKGTATLANNGKFSLKRANVSKDGVKPAADRVFGSDTHRFEYEGFFFGPKAEETVGEISVYKKDGNYEDEVLNFAGQRGEIKK